MDFIPKIDEMIEADDDSTGTLTCGVELEFLIPSIDRMAEDPDPDITKQVLYRSTGSYLEDIRGQIRKQLLNTLRQLDGVPFRAMDDDDFHPPHDNVVIYDSWRLGCDCTVTKSKKRHENFKGPYSWTGCELTSPVLGAHDYAAKIEDVCRILKTVRVHLNGSTAVHVHVGRGNEPFSLPTVKKFATLYWLTEKAIMELHHPSRSDNRHCLPLTQHSVLAARSRAALVDKHREPYDEGLTHLEDYLPKGGLTGPQRAQVRRIWSCGSIEEVAELMWIREDIDSDTPAPPKRGSVGFYRFLPAGKTGGNIQTFEWRQMSGSTDASHINQWIKACIAFTDFCRLSDQTTFKAFVGSIIAKGENYTGIELLEALDVDTQIFRRMQGVWARNRHFYNDSRGRNLFLLDEA